MSRLPPRLAALLGALALTVPAAAQPTLDHLACFKVKDHTGPATYTFSLTNAAGTQNCVAKLPAKLGCFESAESNVVPTPPGGAATRGPAASHRPPRQPRGHPSHAVSPMASARDSAARAGFARRRRRAARASAGRHPVGRRTPPRATASAPTRARRASST